MAKDRGLGVVLGPDVVRPVAVVARDDDRRSRRWGWPMDARLELGALLVVAARAVDGLELLGVREVLDLLEVGVAVDAADLGLAVDRGLELLRVDEDGLARRRISGPCRRGRPGSRRSRPRGRRPPSRPRAAAAEERGHGGAARTFMAFLDRRRFRWIELEDEPEDREAEDDDQGDPEQDLR